MKNRNSIDQSQDIFVTSESSARIYCRNMPAVFARAVNARVWDQDQVEYIDFLSGCGSLNYGHNNPLMKARLIDYLAGDGIVNGLDLHTVAKRDFLAAFREIILEPRGLAFRVQFTGPTGTNAVEAALRLARKVTGRRSVVAFTNAFHGMTLGSRSVSGRRTEHYADVNRSDVTRLPYYGYHGAGTDELDRYEAMVNDPSGGIDPPAAFIVEVVQGEGGLTCARPQWLQHLAALARRLGSLLIVDDVQAGCGRTGDFFSFEHAGIKPDLVCLAKSIGGIGLPMALLLIKPEHDRWEPGEHNGTFRGNNLAFVAARAALDFWRNPDFIREIDLLSSRIRSWISELVVELGPSMAQPRGRGMMSGIAFTDHAIAQRAAQEAFRKGLLVETSGPNSEVVKLLPPLTIEPAVLEDGLHRLKAAIKVACGRANMRPAA